MSKNITVSRSELCHGCGKSADFRCTTCNFAGYCCVECQNAEWETHRAACKPGLHNDYAKAVARLQKHPTFLLGVSKLAASHDVLVVLNTAFDYDVQPNLTVLKEFPLDVSETAVMEGRAENVIIVRLIMCHAARGGQILFAYEINQSTFHVIGGARQALPTSAISESGRFMITQKNVFGVS